MTTDTPLTTAERIRRRRELRDQEVGRTPQTELPAEPVAVAAEPEPTPVTPPPPPAPVTPPPTRRDRPVAQNGRRPVIPAAATEPAAVEERPITTPEPTPEPELPVVMEAPKPTPLVTAEPAPEVSTRMERVAQQAANASQALILGLLEHMRAGEQLLITRDGQGVWSIVLPTSVVGNYQVKVEPSGQPVVQRTVNSGRLPAKFNESLMNPKYLEFNAKWRTMSREAKITHANALGVPVPDSADPRIWNMNLMMGVQVAEGIDKWKPEYSTQAARAAAEENARKGLPY